MADCSKCDGHCCKYITVQIDTPEDDIDFEELKWFLCHKDVLVYIDHDNGWCVEFKTECKYQDPKTNMCTIYDKRPRVCKEHRLDECEGNEDYDDYYKLMFRSMEDIDEYRKKIQSGKKAQKLQKRSTGKAREAKRI
ncbi:hypothetical protein GF323_04935 [Candidatus Woesearchaeota archaeon]|nr:hypothetical protein [Candidatus Woesearchaeota archaeon]